MGHRITASAVACVLFLLAFAGCNKGDSQHEVREPDPEIKLRLAEALRIPVSSLEYRGPWGVFQEWAIAAPTPEGTALLTAFEDKPVLYHSYPESTEVLTPPVEWFPKGTLMDAKQALRLAKLNTERLWLRDAFNPNVQTEIVNQGSWYITVKATISSGSLPFPTVADICLNRKSGAVIYIETGKWETAPSVGN